MDFCEVNCRFIENYNKNRLHHLLRIVSFFTSYFFRLAVENIIIAEEEFKNKSYEDARDLNLMETLLSTPGLTRSDVVTIILDMLFAGVDTVCYY